ncbi:RHS repeat-associated core domain-containing protein [Aquimarina sp. M1]
MKKVGYRLKKRINYYPFGLQHKGYNNTITGREHQFKYNGQELNQSLGYNMTELTFRHYDNALGRFVVPDPLAEISPNLTPFRFGYNNPIMYSDPLGLIEGNTVTIDWNDIPDHGSATYNEGGIVEHFNFAGELLGAFDNGELLFGYEGGFTQLDQVTVINGDSNSYKRAALNIASQINSGEYADSLSRTILDSYGYIEHNYTGLNDILLGAGLTSFKHGYNSGFYKNVNKAYYKTYKGARNSGIAIPKPGVQRQALKKYFSAGKLSKSTKLLRKAGIVGSVLTAGNIVLDGSDGYLNTSSAVDAGLLVVGGIAAIVSAPAAVIVGVGILIYGVLDYSFDISEKLDNKFGEHKIFD